MKTVSALARRDANYTKQRNVRKAPYIPSGHRVHKTATPERGHGGTSREEEGADLSCGTRRHVFHRECSIA